MQSLKVQDELSYFTRKITYELHNNLTLYMCVVTCNYSYFFGVIALACKGYGPDGT